MSEDKRKLFSIVVPIYGNEKNIPITIPYFISKLDLFPKYDVEIIMVCDGSPDASYEEMKTMYERYPGIIRIVNFTRNFGQGAAVHCGMDMAKGDIIGVISCDMQDPFELFVDMVAAWEEGYKLVIASRKGRNESGVSTQAAKLLHRLVNRFVDRRYPTGGFDFFLVDRKVAEQFCQIDAANGSMQMLLIWMGYKYKNIEYIREERKVGKSGYNFWRKLNVAIGIFVTYSTLFTQIWAFIGGGLGLVGAIAFLVTLVMLLNGLHTGIWLVISFVALCTGLVLCSVSAVGEYIWRIFDNSKHRPRYVIDESYE